MNQEEGLHSNSTWDEVKKYIDIKQAPKINISMGKAFAWFMLANLGILITIAVFSGGDLGLILGLILGINVFVPFIGLLLAKWRVKRAHAMRKLSNESCNNDEIKLCKVAESLARKAGLKVTPEVWIYESPDMNAFAVGATKNSSMIAISTALISKMDNVAIASVISHEIAHIANGDMFVLTVVQNIVNLVAFIMILPFQIFTFVCLSDDSILSVLTGMIMAVITFIFAKIVFIFGDIIFMAFSRHREYEADAMAARLVGESSMAHALKLLGEDTVRVPQRQVAFSAMKINNNAFSADGFWEIFSDHPLISKRIIRLEKIASQKLNAVISSAPDNNINDPSRTELPKIGLKNKYSVLEKSNTFLRCLDGIYAGIDIPLSQSPIVIGRDPHHANFILDSPDISRIHARISITEDGSVLLEDLNSSNGTFRLTPKGKERIEAVCKLSIHDKFSIGQKNYRFEIR
ncbi:MAG: M48 family metalloprotease [Acholeplasmataceae bacterium]|nr:M48 family metalloprotease [Acholeplasmataceae bacterium]